MKTAEEILDYNYYSFRGTRFTCQDWKDLSELSDLKECILTCMQEYASLSKDKDECSPVVKMILDERKRQVEVEKYDYNHDASYKNGELIGAAACYAVNALTKDGKIKARVQIHKEAELDFLVNSGDRGDRRLQPAGWYDAFPWDSQYDKRKKHDKIRSLVIAIALLIAELERELPPPPNT